MSRSLSLLALTALSHIQADQLQISENGKPKSIYVLDKASVNPDGASLTIKHGGNAFFSLAPELDPKYFYQPNWLGGSIEFTVNLKNVGCSCNAALYLVSKPAHTAKGLPDAGKMNKYYCDAN